MKHFWRNINNLRWPILGALALALFASVFAWLSHGDREAALRQRDEAALRKSGGEQRLRQARREEQELKERAAWLQGLQQSGITGPERRLEWTELLRDIQNRWRIPGLSYEFGVRQPLGPGSDSHAWFASPLRLQLRLAHEEDLLRVLASLQSEARALVLIRQCSLAPLANAETNNDLAQLAAECDLSWVTLDRARPP
ncbi:MAG: hypothetical protein LBE62_12565 [Azonexus sp.]|jgi:hypothetical protein|nr:hypothetical protein [Azonexus sp.]